MLAILSAICDWRFHGSLELQERMREIPIEEQRFEPIGYDSVERMYYIFPLFQLDCRVYRTYGNKKGCIECVGIDLEETENFIESISKSKNSAEVKLCKTIKDYVSNLRDQFEKREKERSVVLNFIYNIYI